MLTLNSAGGAEADPILAGLGVKLIAGASSMDVATVIEAFIDSATGFPGSVSIKANLSPAAAVIVAGAIGTYNDTTKQWKLSSTTGLTAGDAIYLSHGSITDGIYLLASIVDSEDVTIEGNPLDGAGNKSDVAYQIAWSWEGPTDAAPIVHSGPGSRNFFKFDADDGAVNSQAEDSFWIADAPSGADFVEIEGVAYSGQTVSDNVLALDILRSWSNNGGISHVEMASHSVESVNNFTWTSGGGTGEVTLATALAGLTASAGDGAKYGRLVFKGKSGSSYTVAVDIDVTVDTSGPVLALSLLAA